MPLLNPLVQKQYTEWAYPEPIEDLAVWAKTHCQICDPALHFPILWPERAPDPKLSILVAGCGTSQAAILAFTNPQAQVIGIDISPTSLEHAAKLKAKHNLGNLELREMDLHDAEKLGQRFDLMYATGVLHHLIEPHKGLEALAKTVADDGVLCVMLYAKYGRAGLGQVQDALHILAAAQDARGIALTRQIVESLPPQHAAQPYLRGAAADLKDDACIVDTFLHKQERRYTVPEVLALADSCGLHFQGWTDNLDYYPDGFIATDHPLYPLLASLPEAKQWAVTELLYQNTACHSFLLRKKARRSIHFGDSSFRPWIPARRHLLNVREEGKAVILNRSAHASRLSGMERDLLLAIDGITSCGALMTGMSAESDRARRFFQHMWRLGHLTFRAGS